MVYLNYIKRISVYIIKLLAHAKVLKNIILPYLTLQILIKEYILN
jgi:hypothetical protein